MRIIPATAVLLFMATAPAFAWEARVVHVADGDMITVEPVQGGDRIKVRLHGVDAPERRQPYGQSAIGFVRNVALFKQVDVLETPQGKDRYGRTVAVVEISGVGTLQELLLEAGLAWVYLEYCKNCVAWERIQAQAKSKRKGLWADRHPVPPWKWRIAGPKP
jgi:endonuclease YncB( thermonuclease family)